MPREVEVKDGCGMRVRGDGCRREEPSSVVGSLPGAKRRRPHHSRGESVRSKNLFHLFLLFSPDAAAADGRFPEAAGKEAWPTPTAASLVRLRPPAVRPVSFSVLTSVSRARNTDKRLNRRCFRATARSSERCLTRTWTSRKRNHGLNRSQRKEYGEKDNAAGKFEHAIRNVA